MSHGYIWIEELNENPSIAILCFQGPETEAEIALTREGVSTTIDLLTEWSKRSDQKMDELFSELESLGGAE